MAADGIVPIQQLRDLAAHGDLHADAELEATQFQPNSLDLRLGRIAHRIRCSFLPGQDPVEGLLQEISLDTIDLDRPEGALLDTGKIYLIPLLERLRLPAELHGRAAPRSSTGRIDVLARLLTSGATMFDVVPPGYEGPLYLEVVPRTFPIRARTGDRLSQLRLARHSACPLTDEQLRREIDEHGLIRTPEGIPLSSEQLSIDDGVFLAVGVAAKGDATIGYCARKGAPVIDLRRTDHPRRRFWTYIPATSRRSDHLVLHPNEFYIFSSRSRLVIPPHLCAEMISFDARNGELRHYAGFFDSGFGISGEDDHLGAHVVFELRNLDVPFLLRDDQRPFRLRFYRNAAVPEALYGPGLASSYQGQRLCLSRHFSRGTEAQSSQLGLWAGSS